MNKKYFFLILVCIGLTKGSMAQGHGPLYGLQTPTLPRGHVNLNVGAMSLSSESGESYMLRYMFSYGLTEDLQLNLTAPTPISGIKKPPRTRGNSNMPANSDIEASLWGRIFSNAFDVGKRVESTAVLSGSLPTDKERGKTNVGPSVHGALSTGYASRTWYAWVGGGYQYYFEKNNEQLGDLPYGSLVVGYRPDFIKADWRMFIESLAEFPKNNKSAEGMTIPAHRTQKLLIGPSFLGLYGAWGISFGGLIPVYQNVNKNYQKENFRLSMNISYWL